VAKYPTLDNHGRRVVHDPRQGISKAFFGWTIELAFPLLPLAATPLWLVPAAILAALIPAWRASRIAPALAVRFE
jgi:putative ABC transport system permease protein